MTSTIENMRNLLFMRHGEPDYAGPNSRKSPGWGADIAPLTKNGIKQVLAAVPSI